MTDINHDCIADMDEMTILTEDGQMLKITNMLDVDGDETNDPLQAVVIVAGPDKRGMWLTITLGQPPTTEKYMH